MIHEDYVSFEVAKLLKEKGYNEPCSSVYTNVTLVKLDNQCAEQDWNHLPMLEKVNIYTSAPTLAQAAKWMREKHNLSVEPYTNASGYCWNICKANRDCTCGTWLDDSTNHDDNEFINDCGSFDTYEQALNEGIKEALNMI